MFDQIERAIDQHAQSAKLERVRRLLTKARESLDADLSDPITYRDAVIDAAQVLEAEFGDEAIRVAKVVQAQFGNRAFNKCVTHTTEQLDWYRERTILIKSEDEPT